MRLHIILRTHDGANVHSNKRFINDSKQDIIKKCFMSLIESIKYAENKDDILLTVVDDHSSQETKNYIMNNLKDSGLNYNICELENYGNNESMKKCYELGLKSDKDFIYFVEDDYFHKKEAVDIMIKDYSKFSEKLNNSPITIVPYDDPIDYMSDRIIPTRIVSGTDRHWRQNFHVTFTMMIPKWILLHFWDKFMEMSNYGDGVCEDNTINLLYTKFDTFLFSPMPWLAHHMCDMEPVVGDWKELWK